MDRFILVSAIRDPSYGAYLPIGLRGRLTPLGSSTFEVLSDSNNSYYKLYVYPIQKSDMYPIGNNDKYSNMNKKNIQIIVSHTPIRFANYQMKNPVSRNENSEEIKVLQQLEDTGDFSPNNVGQKAKCKSYCLILSKRTIVDYKGGGKKLQLW